MKIKILVIALVGGMMFGCAPRKRIGERVLLKQEGDCGAWIYVIPKSNKDTMYFMGVSTKNLREEEAFNEARMHATNQIAEMAGIHITSLYEEAISEIGIPHDEKEIGYILNEGMIAFVDNLIKGAKVDRWCKKEYESASGSEGMKYLYDVYVLIAIAVEDYKKIGDDVLSKMKEEAREKKNKKAEEVLERMWKLRKEGLAGGGE